MEHHFEKYLQDEVYIACKELFLQGFSLSQIEKEMNFNRKKLSSILKFEGYDIILNNQKYQYNVNVFSEIDTEEKAYWLGFLYADGNVRIVGSKALDLTLAKKDESHLQCFANFMGNNLRITTRENLLHGYERVHISCRLIVHNSQIVDDLIKWGCVPEKTFVLSPPDINKQFIKHFIRGYFDGDGSVSLANKKYNSRFLGANKEFVTFIRDELHENAFTKKANVKTLSRNNRNDLFEFGFYSYEDNKKLYEYLYSDNCICLNRKKILLENRVFNAPL